MKFRANSGISFKTQLMYTIVFVTRYLHLFHPKSAYLILMKIFFILSSAYILYLMKVQYRYVPSRPGNSFQHAPRERH